jgi:hypothetical protein
MSGMTNRAWSIGWLLVFLLLVGTIAGDALGGP